MLVGILCVTVCCSKSNKKSPVLRTAADSNDPGSPEVEDDRNKEIASQSLTLKCDSGSDKKYLGLGEKDLTAARVDEVPALGDRARIKPFSALIDEFQRVLKMQPQSLVTNGATFSVPPDRWFIEPALNGVNLFTAYRAAYEAAQKYSESNPMLSSAPTEETAAQACALIAESAWNRPPTDADIEACKKVALQDTASVGEIKNRWAYAIASVLAATGFLSY